MLRYYIGLHIKTDDKDMNHTIAEESTEVISALLQEWAKNGNISSLDYDLLTDKIKGLYEMVKFAKPDFTHTSNPLHNHTENKASDNSQLECQERPYRGITTGHNTQHQEEHKKVLGDVIRTCGETIADRLGSPVKDMGTVLGGEKIISLRSAIGLNDKYLIVRDLFGGDMDAFEVAVMRLDEFTSIDEAMLYIHDNYGWSRETDAARMISDILVRKLM